MNHIKKQTTNKIIAVGISFGCCLLLPNLGIDITACIMINCPFDKVIALKSLRDSGYGIYDKLYAGWIRDNLAG